VARSLTVLPDPPDAGISVADEISREMVRIHTESYGSAAKTVKTYVHDDVVLSVLDVELLPAEAVVIAQGRSDLVLDMRSSFQLELETSFTAAIERATGRRVIAFLSDTHLDPPFVTELFRLAPQADDAIVDERPDPPVLAERLPSNLDAAAMARRALKALADDVDETDFQVLQLLVSELVTNAVLHADRDADASVTLEVWMANGHVRVEVGDDGPGFVPVARSPDRETGGWGLVLVEKLATRWGVVSEPSRVWLELDRAC
jgi:anti-sigma regulatory factor (Ser/Thr protein kinase)/uncharacterized protein YbcI